MNASWVATLALGLAVGLSVSPGWLLGHGGRSRTDSVAVTVDDVPVLRRLRVPLSVLAGLAGWAFVGGLIGLLVAAALAVVAGRTLSQARSPSAIRRDERLRADYPLAVELLAHALSAGCDAQSGLHVVAEAVGGPWRAVLEEPLRGLRLGRAAEEVWAELEADSRTSGLGRALARSQETGVPVSEAMNRLSENLREQADLEAQAHARTIEVRAAVPLGVCFLPAFVLLGVVPLVASVLSGLSVVGN